MSCERALYFDQWKTFSENFKPMRVDYGLFTSFTENYCRSRHISEFIHTEKRYPTFLDKICILTWKLLVISKLNFFLWTKLLENLLLAKYLIFVSAPLSGKCSLTQRREIFFYSLYQYQFTWNPVFSDCWFRNL